MTINIKKFHSPTCNPCKILSNYFTEIDLEAEGATLEEIDVMQSPELAEQYELTSVPVLVFERNGVEISRTIGLIPVEEILDSIQNAKEAK